MGVWPLGYSTWKDFSCERMMLPILGVEAGMPFPHFGPQGAEGEDDDVIKKGIKGLAHKILWEISEKETTKKTF